jgi:hypothetical protein
MSNKITIKSSHHDTCATVIPNDSWESVVIAGNCSGDTVLCFPLTKHQRRRVSKKLCGYQDCICGGVLSTADAQVQEESGGGVTVALAVKEECYE